MTPFLINILALLWVARTVKFVLFWIYLWQLKEYHVGRFVDHFRTHKGKKIFFNVLQIGKVILLPMLYLFGQAMWILAAIYLAESVLFAAGVANNNFKRPKFTFKTILLTVVSFCSASIFLYFFHANIIALLTFDILLPIGISLIVLLLQPFFVAARNRVLQKAKQKMGQHENLTVIAITGSYGKTSTKEFLKTILSKKFKVLATPEHKNSEIGIAQTILQDLQPDHQIFIVEMGAYNKGGIKLLCDIVRPDIGMVTGVNWQHLATFGSLENLLSAEGGRELAAQLPNHGMLVVNGENKYCAQLYKNFKGNKRIYTSKVNTIDADLWAEHIEVKKGYLDFALISRQKQAAHFQVNVLGKHNIQNILGAVLIAKELGMGLEEISAACKKITQAQAGITLRVGAHGINVIDSSYSSNPDGVVADLDYLNVFNGKKVVVMPCLIELGSKSAEIHEQLGKKLAHVCDLAIITTKDKFEEISARFINQGLNQHKILFCDDPHEIFSAITTFCKSGDAVLLEGRVPSELIKLLNKEKS